jgi:hypothetical protein
MLKLNVEDLRVDSFDPSSDPDGTSFTAPAGGPQGYVNPGPTDRSCTYCTFVGLICC